MSAEPCNAFSTQKLNDRAFLIIITVTYNVLNRSSASKTPDASTWWRKIILLEKNNFCFERACVCKGVLSITGAFRAVSVGIFSVFQSMYFSYEGKNICAGNFHDGFKLSKMCALCRMQDCKTLQLSICESWLIGGYYYTFIGSWETGENFLRRILHRSVIFNNYGECFRELIALSTKLFVRLSVRCHFDTHIRTMLNLSVECRLESRSSVSGPAQTAVEACER